MWKFLLIGFLFVFPSLVCGQDGKSGASGTTVTITESSGGTRIVAQLRVECLVWLSPTASGPVWIAAVDAGPPPTYADTCASSFTTNYGTRLSLEAGQTVMWVRFNIGDGWVGQLCGKLESGTTDQTVIVSCQ